MQNITKQEYEQILFYWMIEKEKIFGDKEFATLTPADLYEISENLGMDISKAKNLVKKCSLFVMMKWKKLNFLCCALSFQGIFLFLPVFLYLPASDKFCVLILIFIKKENKFFTVYMGC